METEIRMVGWPKRECEVIPVTGMTRKDIMRLTNCPYMTAVTAEKRGYYINDYLKKGIPPKHGFVEGPVDLGRERETIPIPEDINTIEGVMVHFITQATKLFSSSELKSLKMHCLGFRHGNH
ncbi:MAG: hypothetical protein FJ126_01315 [Deltaproteobacteria bacterium]|nr:hypothetical protein [Deltaproteobacteria bacterium]